MTKATKITPEQLAEMLITAKKVEADANKARVEIEQKLIETLGSKEEGSQTHELNNGLKVTVTGKLTYKADMELLMQLAGALPANLRPVKVETKLDETGAKYLKNNEPEIWSMLAPAITIAPAKTSVAIKA